MSVKLVRRRVDHELPGMHPLLSHLFAGRGISDPDDLDLSLRHLYSPDSFRGMAAAVAILQEAIMKGLRILIVGDYDADGATSSALMVLVLREMGAGSVDYLVPDRFRFGYGLTPGIVDMAVERSPDLIITVDNGISSIEGVKAARDRGIRVIVTDHHLSGEELPDADAIINPNQPGCRFPSRAIAGVGVAFYLLSALRASLRAADWFDGPEPVLADYLDLVALGTVADVVPLDRNNRILVEQGIQRIRAGRARAGIRALIDVAGMEARHITTRDLSFAIAPRLNAAGRLESMSLGIECLMADSRRAGDLASRLSELNVERRTIEKEMKWQAEEYLERWPRDSKDSRSGICLFDPDWHQGVIGILASRIKDRFHRPVIAFARVSPGELKGSARSIPGFHIRDALAVIAARHPGLLTRFGGHAMAAGLSLDPSGLDRFSALFDAQAREWIGPDDLEQVLVSDGTPGDDWSLDLVRRVIEAAPWGQGFPEPLFDGEFEILGQRIVAERHLKMKLRPVDASETLEAIAFNQDRLLEKRIVHLAYRLDINRYRGRETVQLIVEAVDVSLGS